MADLAWFPFYVGDFLSSRRTRTMTAEQVGVYLLLLCEQWDHGPIPDDPGEIEDICRVDRSQASAVLQRCFELTLGGWVNRRLEEIRAEQEEKRLRLSEAGRRGGVSSGHARRSKPGSSQAQAGLQRSLAQARLKPGSSSRREEKREEETTTSAQAPDVDKYREAEEALLGVAESEATRMLSTSELEELAATRLGLGLLPPIELRANRSLLVSWEGRGRSLEEIEAAILGLADIVKRRRPEVADWLPPGKPITLKALQNTMTLYDQGDGKAQRPLWDVAVEFHRSSYTPPTVKRGGGPERIHVDPAA